jgi:hypothetical protein
MGQCNTQPEDGMNGSGEMFRQFSNDKWKGMAYTNLPSPEKLPKNVYETRDVSSNNHRGYDNGQERQDYHDHAKHKMNQYSNDDFQKKTPPRHSNPTRNGPFKADSLARGASQEKYSSTTPSRLSDSSSLSLEAQVSVPEGAVRTRCYRLNLDVDGIVSPTNGYNGPFEYDPAFQPQPRVSKKGHSYEYNEEIMANVSSETSDESDKQVAIKTAQIFRDLAITDDGNIVSMNPRANRGSSKSKVKPGEKSRQAAKIDKAKDLIDEVGVITDKEVRSQHISYSNPIVIDQILFFCNYRTMEKSQT